MTSSEAQTNGELFAQFFKTQIDEPETERTIDDDTASDDFKTFFGIN